MFIYILLISLLSTLRAKRLPIIVESIEDEPTIPTSLLAPRTPTSTDVSEKGMCRKNSCGLYGTCQMIGSTISICNCDRNHFGQRCSTTILEIPTYLHTKEAEPVVEEILLHQQGENWERINEDLYRWSEREQKKSRLQSKGVDQDWGSRRRNKQTREKDEHLILHSAFKANFGGSRNNRRGGSGKNGGRMNRFRRGIVTGNSILPTIRHRKMVCVSECRTYIAHIPRLCPITKLAVVLRVETSSHPPLRKVTCCTANISDTCGPLATPILAGRNYF